MQYVISDMKKCMYLWKINISMFYCNRYMKYNNKMMCINMIFFFNIYVKYYIDVFVIIMLIFVLDVCIYV